MKKKKKSSRRRRRRKRKRRRKKKTKKTRDVQLPASITVTHGCNQRPPWLSRSASLRYLVRVCIRTGMRERLCARARVSVRGFPMLDARAVLHAAV